MVDAEDVSLDMWEILEAWCRRWKIEKTGHVKNYVYDTLFVFAVRACFHIWKTSMELVVTASLVLSAASDVA